MKTTFEKATGKRKGFPKMKQIDKILIGIVLLWFILFTWWIWLNI